MGLLSNDYYQNLAKQAQPMSAPATPSITPEKVQATAPAPTIFDKINSTVSSFSPYESYIDQSPKPLVPPGIDRNKISSSTPVRAFGDISPQDQAGRFGGPVGSTEYYNYKAEHPYLSFLPQQVGTSFGLKFPDMETWDKMTRYDQASHIGEQTLETGIRMLADLPRQVVIAPIRYGISTYQAWSKLAQGKIQGNGEQAIFSAAEDKPVELPWLGAIPTYWKSYKDARDSGAGPLGATLLSAGTALGDATIGGALAEGLAKGLQPRTAIKEGQPITNTGPIKNALIEQQGKMVPIKKAESMNEYYRLPKTTAKDIGGSTSNTFLKISPAGTDSVEVSIVQVRAGAVPQAVDFVKGKLGNPVSTYAGDFGPEIKLKSKVVQIQKQKEIPAFETKTSTSLFSVPKDQMNRLVNRSVNTEISIQENPAFSLTKYATNNKRELPEVLGADKTARGAKVGQYGKKGDQIITELGFDDLTQAERSYDQLVKLRDDRVRIKEQIKAEKKNASIDINKELEQASINKSVDLEAQIQESIDNISSQVLSSIPPKALKGFENKPITSDQMRNLNLIGKVNGIEPGVMDAVIRNIAGNKAFGELSQTEYVRAAQTLGSFNNLNKYAPDAGTVNIFARYGSPQRHWTRTYEEKTGIPLYSEGYVPMEEAVRLRDAFRDSYRNQAREIYGKYAGTGFAEERRLIKNYMEGKKEVILFNEKLTPQVRADLIKISDSMRPLYDKLGPMFDVPMDVFLKDYQPHIADLGGVFQLYKEGQPIPKELTFFAKFKRRGGLTPQIDDSLALFDIYTNSGSNKLFLNPALERAGKLGEQLPATLQSSLKSYVQEKLGYANQLDEWINNVGTNLNKKLGTNLPPDVVRQTMQIGMDTTYSGGMGLNPGTVLRNGLQYDLMTYPRLGPEGYVYAADYVLNPKTRKLAMKEVREAGFLVDRGELYGQALTQEVNIGGKAVNLYRKGTQATLAPFSAIEELNRARTYYHVKFQFNRGKDMYNSGRWNWSQFENNVPALQGLSPIDMNIIRQRLIAGDMKGAFENLAREVIDETQFPYRRGSSSRITFGTTGKIGTQFNQWNIEFVHTMGRWVKDAAQGRPEKLIRFAASSFAIQRTLSDTLGFDFSRSVFFGPFGLQFSPFVKTSIDFVEGLDNWRRGNAEAFQQNADNITRTLKSLGIPAGVEIQKWNNFLKSIKAWEGTEKTSPVRGPNNEYPVLDSRGRVLYFTTFDDIFWQAFGFPTNKKEEYLRQSQDIRNAKFDYTQIKSKVLQLYQQEKYDEANSLINQYGIKISPSDFDQYYIPFSDRTFRALPSALKAQFAPQLYPVK